MYTTAGRWVHSGELWTDWCGGFLAGMMWLFHQRTNDRWWRTQGEHYSQLLEHRKADRNVHDLGFIFLNTYRRWFEVSGDPSLMDVVAEAGVTLAGRFQGKGQYLASFLGPHSLFIDIMMNVPLLYVAADWLESHSGNPPLSSATHHSPLTTHLSASELRRIATAHCLTSQRYLVRADGSTAHEAIFDPETGQFLRESTQQGLRPDSCWSRGLAWALYGFGTVYGLTGDRQFLETAIRCADYFLAHLPPGMVPYWDFDLPDGPDRIWDSSAAAIAASGLLQLAEVLGDPDGEDERRKTKVENQPLQNDASPSPGSRLSSPVSRASRYRDLALLILDALCSERFLAAGWEGILRHAVYHFHKKLGVDESVMWGDYFFVEALDKALAVHAHD